MSEETGNDPHAIGLKDHISSLAAERLRLLEEKIARVDEKIEAAEKLSVERDKRYSERFEGQTQAIKDALTAQKEAVNVAERNAEKWRESANEWRGAMSDRERSLIPRTEAEKGMLANSEKIRALESRIDRNEGRSSGLMMVFVVIAAIGTLVSVVVMIFAAVK